MINFKKYVDLKLSEIDKSYEDIAKSMKLTLDEFEYKINHLENTPQNEINNIWRVLMQMTQEYQKNYIPGLVIKDQLKKHNMSQVKLAQLLEIDTSTISRYINGSRDLNTSIINKICDIFNISADELLGRK